MGEKPTPTRDMSERQPAEMTEDELLNHALTLSEQRSQGYLSENRKQQLSLKMNRIIFEIQFRDGLFADQPDAA